MALIADIAEQVALELNGGAFSLTFFSERHYLPRFDQTEMDELRVLVVPRGTRVERSARDSWQHDYQIDVAIAQKVADEEASTLDPLMGLVEELAEYMRGRALNTDPTTHCVAVENAPIYSPDHLDDKRLFLSVLRLTFRTWRRV